MGNVITYKSMWVGEPSLYYLDFIGILLVRLFLDRSFGPCNIYIMMINFNAVADVQQKARFTAREKDCQGIQTMVFRMTGSILFCF